jgi:predicted AlkP superfamily pyrophosphatase or phosphodiesterase
MAAQHRRCYAAAMRSALLFAAAATLVAVPAAAQPARPPKLIVAISVDQLSSDLFEAYRPHFSAGFKRLAEGSVLFTNGYQAHAATETCPGHSTLLTGRWPAATGVVANTWVDQRAARDDKTIYCAEDPRVPGSTSRNYTVSPQHLKSSTVGDRLKALNPASRNVAVSGKDRAAVMMSGARADQRWYWDGKAWSTDLRSAPVPRSVAAFRTAFAAQLGAARPGLTPPALCQAKATPFQVTPALTVGNGTLARAAGDARAMRASPELDGASLALAYALTQELGLGRGQAPDVLSIGLSATDYVGHSFGWGGQEMCLQMLALDRELGDFLARMDATGIEYAVVLSADHGGMDLAERLRAGGNSRAQRVDAALDAGEVGKLLAPQFGRTAPVLVGETSGDVWLDKGLPAADRPRVLAAALARYRAHPQVQAVFTAEELGRTPLPSGDPRSWSLIQRVRATFDPTRSGDFYVVLKEWVTPITRPGQGYVAGHGTPWDYDRRVPILFYARGLKPAAPTAGADTADILPTLASWFGLLLAPGSIDGRCRTEAARCR